MNHNPVSGTPSEHKEAFAATLVSSGFSPTDAAKLHFDFLNCAETSDLTGNYFNGPSIRINYFDLDGKIDPAFFRVRRLTEERFDNKKAELKPRYWQRANTLPRLYFPPLIKFREIAADPRVPLVFVEGEKKAAAFVKTTGKPAIGLGGIHAWKAKKSGVVLLPEFDNLSFANRKLEIVFDSDLDGRADILGYIYRIANQFVQRGAARVDLVTMPSLPDSDDKIGLDDYLVAGHKTLEDFLKLPRRDLAAVDELERINNEFILLISPPRILDRSRLSHLRVSEFHDVLKDRSIEQINEHGKQVKVYHSDTWIDWPGKLKAHSKIYQPYAPLADPMPVFIPNPINRDGLPDYNTHWPYGASHDEIQAALDSGKKPELFLELIDHVLGHQDTEDFVKPWLMKWLAWPWQHPEEPKLNTALVFYSDNQGTGKSFICEILNFAYGENTNGRIISGDGLTTPFNAFMAESRLLCFDDTDKDKRFDRAAYIKSIITSRSMRVQEKFVAATQEKLHFNAIISTNSTDAIALTRKDRRFFMIQASEVLLKNVWSRAKIQELKSYRIDSKKAALVIAYLLKYDLGDFDFYEHAPVTKFMMDMIDDQQSEQDQWVADKILDPSVPDLVKIESFVEEYNTTVNTSKPANVRSMGWSFRHLGLLNLRKTKVNLKTLDNNRKVNHEVKSIRLWAIRNFDKWSKAEHAQISAEFAKTINQAADVFGRPDAPEKVTNIATKRK